MTKENDRCIPAVILFFSTMVTTYFAACAFTLTVVSPFDSLM